MCMDLILKGVLLQETASPYASVSLTLLGLSCTRVKAVTRLGWEWRAASIRRTKDGLDENSEARSSVMPSTTSLLTMSSRNSASTLADFITPSSAFSSGNASSKPTSWLKLNMEAICHISEVLKLLSRTASRLEALKEGGWLMRSWRFCCSSSDCWKIWDQLAAAAGDSKLSMRPWRSRFRTKLSTASVALLRQTAWYRAVVLKEAGSSSRSWSLVMLHTDSWAEVPLASKASISISLLWTGAFSIASRTSPSTPSALNTSCRTGTRWTMFSRVRFWFWRASRFSLTSRITVWATSATCLSWSPVISSPSLSVKLSNLQQLHSYVYRQVAQYRLQRERDKPTDKQSHLLAAATHVWYGLHRERQTVPFAGCCYVWDMGHIERESHLLAAATCVGYGLHTARQTVLFSGCCYIHVWETGCTERDRQTDRESHLLATATM